MSSKYHGTPDTHVTWIGTGTPVQKRKGGIRGRTPTLTDAQILELRALNEFAGWGAKALRARFGLGSEAVQRILQGVTRGKLVPTRKHLPQELEAA